jgi:ubiquinone/menaquinone biosynthesis C-methylase UbiE
MDHSDHLDLLREGIPDPGGSWADFGSGRGAFTLALAELIGPQGEIFSVDRDGGALRNQRRAFQATQPQFPPERLHLIAADFTQPVDLPLLDGAVAANSIHFLRDKQPFLGLVHGYLHPGGRFILIEYNVDRGNLWVPHPVSFETWKMMAGRSGFGDTRLLHTRPSRFLKEIYSAVSIKQLE